VVPRRSYIDIGHPEIEEFITIRKSTGGDEHRKAVNLHNAVNITDDFMIAVRDDMDWNLVDPHSGRVKKTLRARNLWRFS
jgi:ribonucleoside-diphosphate reductase alpha chain